MTINSTHAAWLNLILGILAVVADQSGALHLPSWTVPAVAALNVLLHAYLPDAPPGAGLTGIGSK